MTTNDTLSSYLPYHACILDKYPYRVMPYVFNKNILTIIGMKSIITCRLFLFVLAMGKNSKIIFGDRLYMSQKCLKKVPLSVTFRF